uniref:Metalloendopeptidase n=1 Tax=Spodoptera frugiperda TaxID=7108 RepID=A0A2H1WVD0_SPOFR
MLPSSFKMEQFHTIILVLSIIIAIATTAPISENVDVENEGEYGDYFEGDMLLSKSQREAILQAADGNSRNGLRNVAKRWPNRTVVYHINDDDFDEEQVQKIEDALADIANHSCISFRSRAKDDEHAVIIQGTEGGCFSNVGLSTPSDEGETRQVLNLAKGCFKHGTVIHEMLHTIGFYHMQSTYDRDDFVTILWENIKPGHEHNFAKYSNDTVTDFGVPYDYDSVMHYTEKAFSANGNNTIVPLKANVTIGQRMGLSESDILKLNKMYCEENDEEEVMFIEDIDEIAFTCD